jgi:hypothetical protein
MDAARARRGVGRTCARAIALGVIVAAAGCGGGEPAPPASAPARTGGDGPLERRGPGLAARIDRLRGDQARLEAELARLRAENDLAHQAWAKESGEYLRRRAALNLSPPRSAGEVEEERRLIVRRRRSARAEAAAAAEAVLVAERRAHEVELELERLRAGQAVEGSPSDR